MTFGLEVEMNDLEGSDDTDSDEVERRISEVVTGPIESAEDIDALARVIRALPELNKQIDRESVDFRAQNINAHELGQREPGTPKIGDNPYFDRSLEDNQHEHAQLQNANPKGPRLCRFKFWSVAIPALTGALRTEVAILVPALTAEANEGFKETEGQGQS